MAYSPAQHGIWTKSRPPTDGKCASTPNRPQFRGPTGLAKMEHLLSGRSLDRLSGGLDNQPRKRAEYLNRAIAGAERHIRLVFHRFMTEDRPGLSISLNGRDLEPSIPSAPGFCPIRAIGRTGWSLVTELWNFSASRCRITNQYPGLTGKTWRTGGAPQDTGVLCLSRSSLDHRG
jgi:hypothetical protein